MTVYPFQKEIAIQFAETGVLGRRLHRSDQLSLKMWKRTGGRITSLSSCLKSCVSLHYVTQNLIMSSVRYKEGSKNYQQCV